MPRVCSGDAVYECRPDGTFGEKLYTCAPETCHDGACGGGDDCTVEAQRIYLVDDRGRLLSFDPADGTNKFTEIGTLSCPTTAPLPDWPAHGRATPFSMSVDRSARAWVLYSSGEVFWVSTQDASCVRTPYARGGDGFELFGMGFVSDAVGSDAEKLYISGGAVNGVFDAQLGWIDPTSLAPQAVGPLPMTEYGPELTGTGNGELYGYYPGAERSFVAHIDKETGQSRKEWDVPPLDGPISAWAFAHWGGQFYVFVTTLDETNWPAPKVLRLDPETGEVVTLVEWHAYSIVGAGVSTCAPLFQD